MDPKKVDNDTGEMIVKRVSVPIGLEELMEGLAKEVLLKKPEDLYLFAAKYFSHLLLLRDKTNYKIKTVRSAQSVIEPDQKWSGIPYIVRANQKQLTRQISVRSETPSARKNATTKPPQKDKQDVLSRNQPDTLTLEGHQKYMSNKRGYRRISLEKPKNVQMRDRSNSNEKPRPGASIAQPVQRQRRASLKKDEKPNDQRPISKIPTAEAVKIPKQNDEPISQKGVSSSEDPKSTTSSEAHSDKSTSDKIDSDTQSKSSKDQNLGKDVAATEKIQPKSASPSPNQTSVESNKPKSTPVEKQDSPDPNKTREIHQINTNMPSSALQDKRDFTDVDKQLETKMVTTTKSVKESKKVPSDVNNGKTIEPNSESTILLNQTSIQKSKSISEEKKSSGNASMGEVNLPKFQDQEIIEVEKSESVQEEIKNPSSSQEALKNEAGTENSKSAPNEENGSNKSRIQIKSAKSSDQGIMGKQSKSLEEERMDPSIAKGAEEGTKIASVTPLVQKSKSDSDEEKSSNYANNKTSTGSPDKTETSKTLDQVINTTKAEPTKTLDSTGIEAKNGESISGENYSTTNDLKKKIIDTTASLKSPENKGFSRVGQDSILSSEEDESDDKLKDIKKMVEVEEKSPESGKESKVFDMKDEISNDSPLNNKHSPTTISEEKPEAEKRDSSTTFTEAPTRTNSQENKFNNPEVRNTSDKTTPTISISDHSTDLNELDQVDSGIEKEMVTNEEVRKSNDQNLGSDVEKGTSSIDDGNKGNKHDPSMFSGVNYSEDNTLADISDEEEINGNLSEKTRLKRESQHKQEVEDSVSNNKSCEEIKVTSTFLEKEKSGESEIAETVKNEFCIDDEKSTKPGSDGNEHKTLQSVKEKTNEDINKTEGTEKLLKLSTTEIGKKNNNDIDEKSEKTEVSQIDSITIKNDVKETTSPKLDTSIKNQVKLSEETLSAVEKLAPTPPQSDPEVETVENKTVVDETKDQNIGNKNESSADGNFVLEDMKKQLIPIASQEEERNKDDPVNKTNGPKIDENKEPNTITEGAKKTSDVLADGKNETLKKRPQNGDQLRDPRNLHTSNDEVKDPKYSPFNESVRNIADDSNNNKTESIEDQIIPSNTSIPSESNKNEEKEPLDDVNNNYTKRVVNTLTLIPQKLSNEETEPVRKGNIDDISQETTKSSEIIAEVSRNERSIDMVESDIEGKRQSETASVEETKVEKCQTKDNKIKDSASSEKYEAASTEGEDNKETNQSDVILESKIDEKEQQASREDSDKTSKNNEVVPAMDPVSVNTEIAKEETHIHDHDSGLLQNESPPAVKNVTDQDFKRSIDVEIAKKILEESTCNEAQTAQAPGTTGIEEVDDDIIAKELLTALSQNDSAEGKDTTEMPQSEFGDEEQKDRVKGPQERKFGPSNEEVIRKTQVGVASENKEISGSTVDQESLDSTISALKTGVIDRAVRDYVNTFLSKEKVYNSAKLLDETKIAQHVEHINNRSARTQSLEEQRNRVNTFLTKSKSVDGKDAVTSKFDIEKLREQLGLSKTESKLKYKLNKSLAVLKIQSLWRGFIVRKNLNEFTKDIEVKPSQAHENHLVQQTKPDALAAPAAKESSSDSDRPASIDSTDSTVTVISAEKLSDQTIHQHNDLPSIEREHLLTDYQDQLLERISGKSSKTSMDLPEEEMDEDPFCGTTLERNGSSGILGTVHEEENSDVEDTANAPLLHTGELHDSIILPLSSKIEDSMKNLKDDPNDPKIPRKNLLHTGELHDSVLLPIETLGELKGMEDVAQKRPSVDLDVGDGVVGVAHASPGVVGSARAAPASATLASRLASTMAENVGEPDRREDDKDMESEAATKIQAGFRGYQVRKQLKMKNGSSDLTCVKKPRSRKESATGANNNKKDLEEKSAVKIQAGIRGFLVRRRQKKQGGGQE